MDASWDLVTDNLLDTSHVAFLHEGNLGNPSMVDAKTLVEQRDKTHVIVTREFQDIPTTPLWDLLFFNQVSRVNAYINMNWHAPACLINDTGATPTGGSCGARYLRQSLSFPHLPRPRRPATITLRRSETIRFAMSRRTRPFCGASERSAGSRLRIKTAR